MKKIFSYDFSAGEDTDSMAQLYVSVSGAQGIALPLTIRNAGMQLIGNSNTDAWITLKAGNYVIQLHAPDGIEYARFVELKSAQGKEIEIILTSDDAQVSDINISSMVDLRSIKDKSTASVPGDNTQSNRKLILAIPQRIGFKTLEKSLADINVKLSRAVNFNQASFHIPDEEFEFGNIETIQGLQNNQQISQDKCTGCMVRVLQYENASWSVLEQGLDTLAVSTDKVGDYSRTVFTFYARDNLQVLEVRKSMGESVYLVLPLAINSLTEQCKVELWDNGIDVRLKGDFSYASQASSVLNFFSTGSYDFAINMVGQAEHMLYSKIQNPIEAALGGYALLRIGDIERMHNWPKNLCNWFPYLADGAIIAAELELIKNNEDDALDLFLEAGERGLPIFKEGLAILVSRLRSYLMSDGQKNRSEDKLAKLNASYQFFAEVALYAEDSQLLSFRGLSLLDDSQSDAGWQFILPSQIKQQGHEWSTLPVFFQVEQDV